MKSMTKIVLLTLTTATLTGCEGGGTGPGYWFQFILIVIPLFILGYVVVKRLDGISDSIFNIESKLNQISDVLDKVESSSRKPKPKK